MFFVFFHMADGTFLYLLMAISPGPSLTAGRHPRHFQSASDRCRRHPSPRRRGRPRRRSLHSGASSSGLGFTMKNGETWWFNLEKIVFFFTMNRYLDW